MHMGARRKGQGSLRAAAYISSQDEEEEEDGAKDDRGRLLGQG